MEGSTVHAFDVLGDPVRRRILELLADGERSAGEIAAVVQREFGISQSGVSQHLRVLRENGFARGPPVGGPRPPAVSGGDGLRAGPPGGRPTALRRRADSAAGRRPVARAFPSHLGPAPRRTRHRARPRQAGAAPAADPTSAAGQGPGGRPRGGSVKDVLEELAATAREVARRGTGDDELIAVALRREYPVEVEDVWEALTDPQRVARWFGPVSGDLRKGGAFRVE